MICPKCTREMVETGAKSTTNPYTRRFVCGWCKYSWEGIVNRVLHETLRSKQGYDYGSGFSDL